MSGWVGRPLRRREDRRLVTGRGRFVDDLAPPGLCHLALVRSPHAHALIRAVDTTDAWRAAGVVLVLTAADLDPLGPMPIMRPLPGMVVPEHPLLAAGAVRAQGVPVAAVLAGSAAGAADGAARVRVEYEALPGVAGADAALAAGRDAALMARVLVCEGLPLDPAHIAHARARWDVWTRGYGLLCDVEGVLYVYRTP